MTDAAADGYRFPLASQFAPVFDMAKANGIC